MAQRYQTEHDLPNDGYIFSMSDEPANYRSISACFGKYTEKSSGIRKSSHKARKTYISTLIDDDEISDDSVREVVGHKSLSTTYDSYFYDRKASKRSELFEKALSK